ncbi:DUF982 domain-containing protein [Mesorhizobium sp. M00.F.Ca.ET.151.01.1.1]|uniref:DUF982 domain-containing protein n=1 Tax=Mesorhizobium sp. M8A.F.Ca.ET.207.01.1.1 TaxID=2563968 RepID=UPI00109C1E92|nr:DUF982 domain-containing protein [Mesorhizobium sp. M8A.F.Ca.ET.207.01.1.1]TGQ83697.1 DUF982 domain-containing protein [Mesorhizobium sp. M8A.F.Ca.ET.207.01.1.1]TGU86293.1 DUF982 domain-containing protein [Mesorhizobium sp. M00.F.Ca.ET.151.01.1.1]
MALHWFSPPVYIKDTKPGMTAGINHIEGASERLLTFTKRGPKWDLAVRACMAALADQATPQEVRRCFRLAAKEEGILRENP